MNGTCTHSISDAQPDVCMNERAQKQSGCQYTAAAVQGLRECRSVHMLVELACVCVSMIHDSRNVTCCHCSAAEQRVVVDGNLVTSRGPGTALEFALALVKQLYGSVKAKEVAGPMVVHDSVNSLIQA